MADHYDIPRGQVPPHSETAEKSVLGALLLAPGRLLDIAEFLKPDDFFAARHGKIYETIVQLSERGGGIDITTVAEHLKVSGDLAPMGGSAYLAELATSVASAAHLQHHAQIISQTSLLRGIIGVATDVVTKANATAPDQESVQELLDTSEHAIFSLSQGRETSGAVGMADVIKEAFLKIENQTGRGELTGLTSGFFELDEMTGGFNPGEMTIIAARPSMGKTAFVLNVMERAAMNRPDHMDHDPVVLFFSLEMGKLSIVQRMLCSRARVDAHRLRTGKIDPSSYADLSAAAGELAESKLFIDDTPGLSIMALRSRARRIKHRHGLDMIVIDYLQLMTAKAESRQQEISMISRSLKELARELEVPLIALSQLSRGVESREDKRPQLSDLRESGSIEQDADVVMMLYRAEYYSGTEENKGQAEVIIAKQRNGATGGVKLQFQGSILRFDNPAPGMAEPISL
ncbi:MAG: replicative DNA helicase [Planctomycetota bacterium]